jgi:hypothetical protein
MNSASLAYLTLLQEQRNKWCSFVELYRELITESIKTGKRTAFCKSEIQEGGII